MTLGKPAAQHSTVHNVHMGCSDIIKFHYKWQPCCTPSLYV